MKQEKILAMILAGGRGSRLHQLTERIAKPAVFFGGQYRIIDFPLSNCANSGIDTVGVLTQYESVLLNSYVSEGARWGLDTFDGGAFVLAPRERHEGFDLYRGTADAISQNIDFIDQHDPDYILILSGDHIYNMDYSKMLECHKSSDADLTIAVLEVTMKEAQRFGIMNTNDTDQIIDFEEKPKKPKSNLASMGIYFFNWKKLKRYLQKDMRDDTSEHDFGKNIIPAFLENKEKLQAYRFKGYWKDVGTLESLWESNMDILNGKGVDIDDANWRVYSKDTTNPPQYILQTAQIHNIMLGQGSIVGGKVENSVIFNDVVIEEGATVKDCVVLPSAVIKKGANVRRLIIAEDVVVHENVEIIVKDDEPVELIWKDQKVEL
ncbi:MAG: glucose-1-phosphate adenylyltransferase [Breznakia sp.]